MLHVEGLIRGQDTGLHTEACANGRPSKAAINNLYVTTLSKNRAVSNTNKEMQNVLEFSVRSKTIDDLLGRARLLSNVLNWSGRTYRMPSRPG